MIYTQSSLNCMCMYSAKFNSFYNDTFSDNDNFTRALFSRFSWKRVKYLETYLISICHLWHVLCTLLSTIKFLSEHVHIQSTSVVQSRKCKKMQENAIIFILLGCCYAMTKSLCKLHSFFIRMSISRAEAESSYTFFGNLRLETILRCSW